MSDGAVETTITNIKMEDEISLNGDDQLEKIDVADQSDDSNDQEDEEMEIDENDKNINDSGKYSDEDSNSSDFLGFAKEDSIISKKEFQLLEQAINASSLFEATPFHSESLYRTTPVPSPTLGKGKRSRIPNKRYKNPSLTSPFQIPLNQLQLTPTSTSSSNKKMKSSIDMKNPDYLRPFLYGWKRELVYRATVDSNFRRNGDIYYYTPEGRKIRSMRELNELLSVETFEGALKSTDFTFFKEPVGVGDPEKEIIREAKFKSSTLIKQGLIKSETLSNRKNKASAIKVKLLSNNNKKEQVTPSPTKSTPSTPKRLKHLAELQQRRRRPPCSLRCPGLTNENMIPTLQCTACLCLYHHHCVEPNMPPDDQIISRNYICKNCEPDEASLPPGPSSLTNLMQPPPPPPVLPIPPPSTIPPPVINQITTWFPPNTHLQLNHHQQHQQLNNNCNGPQSVVTIKDRKYIVVPKGNVLSVSTANDPGLPKQADVFPNHKAQFLLSTRKSLRNSTMNQMTTRSATTPTPATPKSVPATPVAPVQSVPSIFMQNYLQNINYGYKSLLHVFHYLKMSDLLRAACVCRLWNQIAADPTLWTIVRLKNSQVSDWNGLAQALNKHNTQVLDLRKMLLQNTSEETWAEFAKAVVEVKSLRRVEFCKCPAQVVEHLTQGNRQLKVINALAIRCDSIDLSSIEGLSDLEELRLKSTNGFHMNGKLMTILPTLSNLRHLSLTSFRNLSKQSLEAIVHLKDNLITLELGECFDFPMSFPPALELLVNLEKLRLEKGQGQCPTFEILEAVSTLPKLEQLELINFDIKSGFNDALAKCQQIKKLLIIPTYISQSATTNHMVLSGVLQLTKNLSHFVWGVTLELLRVTELFIDQCDDTTVAPTPPIKKNKKSATGGDSIPVLKPIPFPLQESQNIEKTTPEEDSNQKPPQVEILPLPLLQKMLLNSLPSTKVKILKIPFHATWRQSIVDSTLH